MAVAMAFGPTPASELLDQAEELVAATSSSHFCTGIVLVSLAYCQAISGDFDQARLTSAEARQLANEYGLGGLLLDLTKGDGEIERLAGDLAAAEQHLRTASELQRAWSSTPSLDLAAAFGRVTLAQGRLAETLDLTSLDETEARDRPSELAAWQSIRALALARSGDLQQADRLSAEAVTLVAADLLDLRAQTLADRADVLLRAGRQSEGTEALKEALATYERKGNLVMAERTREQLTQLATPAQRRRRTR
jgi:hypothetical protein